MPTILEEAPQKITIHPQIIAIIDKPTQDNSSNKIF
jgi:hypothetical protein